MGWGIEKEKYRCFVLNEEEITVEKLLRRCYRKCNIICSWQQAGEQCQILYDLGNSEIVREYTLYRKNT